MGLFEAREDVAWAAPILVLILPHDLLTATEVVRHLLLSVLQGAVHSAVKNWIFILISLKFTWGELCKRPGLRLQIGSMPTSQLTRGSANDLWTFHWVSLCPNSIHWCVELYQLSNYKYDYIKHENQKKMKLTLSLSRGRASYMPVASRGLGWAACSFSSSWPGTRMRKSWTSKLTSTNSSLFLVGKVRDLKQKIHDNTYCILQIASGFLLIEDKIKDEKQSENAIIGGHNEDCTN